ncbi:MAG: hypothetical protein R2724_34565 [Bryobacterales bacterium]
MATVDEMKGVPQFKLSELGLLSDERLGNIIPKVLEDKIRIEENRALFVKQRKSDIEKQLLVMTSVEQAIFKHFSGTLDIREIAYRVSKRHDLEIEEAFQATKNLFLNLAKYCVCFPVNIV